MVYDGLGFWESGLYERSNDTFLAAIDLLGVGNRSHNEIMVGEPVPMVRVGKLIRKKHSLDWTTTDEYFISDGTWVVIAKDSEQAKYRFISSQVVLP